MTETNQPPHGGATPPPRSGTGQTARAAQVRAGLERAVTGREEHIKRTATSIANSLNNRTGQRHRAKIGMALTVVNFAVDLLGKRGRGESTDPFGASSSTAGSGNANAGSRSRRAEPDVEDLGEFRNLSDEPKR